MYSTPDGKTLILVWRTFRGSTKMQSFAARIVRVNNDFFLMKFISKRISYLEPHLRIRLDAPKLFDTSKTENFFSF